MGGGGTFPQKYGIRESKSNTRGSYQPSVSMARPKLHHKQMTCHLPADTHAEIHAHCLQHGHTKGEVFTMAWKSYKEQDSAYKAVAAEAESLRVALASLMSDYKTTGDFVKSLQGKLARAHRRLKVHGMALESGDEEVEA